MIIRTKMLKIIEMTNQFNINKDKQMVQMIND